MARIEKQTKKLKRTWGGARPGAGRKPKAQLYESEIEVANKRAADKLPRIADLYLKAALGEVSGKTDDGRNIYSRRPDVQACIYIINRIMGKPTPASEDRNEVEKPRIHIYTPQSAEAVEVQYNESDSRNGEQTS